MSNKKQKCLSLSKKVAERKTFLIALFNSQRLTLVLELVKLPKSLKSGGRKLKRFYKITYFETLTSFEPLDGPQTNLKRFRTGKFDDVNKALWDW